MKQKLDISEELTEAIFKDDYYHSLSDEERALYREQFTLEYEQSNKRLDKFHRDIKKLESKGKGRLAPAGIKVITDHVKAVSDDIVSYLQDRENNRRYSTYKLLSKGRADSLAIHILQATIDGIRPDDDDDDVSFSSLAVKVGNRIEDCFRKEDFPRGWNKDKRERCGGECLEKFIFNKPKLGRKVKEIIKKDGRDVEINRVKLGDDLVKHARYFKKVFPPDEPMICRPRPWAGPEGGGYLLNATRRKKTAIIKESRNSHPDQLKGITYENMRGVFDAINGLQSVAWKINRPMREAIERLWIEAERDKDFSLFWKKEPKESDREKRVGHLTTVVEEYLNQAIEYEDRERFFLPVNMDWRGRVFYLPKLNPQGPDMVRAMLDFADEKPLSGRRRHFMAYGKRLFGGVNDDTKNPTEELLSRVEWCKENTDKIIQAASDPNSKWWRGAKEPFRFLRWCLDYSRYIENPDTFKTGMVHYVDATSSGIQHFALLLRDENLAPKVNLTYGPKQDAYALVANGLNDELKKLAGRDNKDSCMAKKWLDIKKGEEFHRGDMKNFVMCIPYGKSDGEYTKDILNEYMEPNEDGEYITSDEDMAKWLLSYIKKVIREKLPGIYKIRTWARKVCGAYNEKNKHVKWPSQEGFVVKQRYFLMKGKQIVYWAWGKGGKKEMSFVVNEKTKLIDKDGSWRGITPNFVHSIDSAALVEAVNLLIGKKVESVSVIHDCFGSHFSDILQLEEATRDGLYNVHNRGRLQYYHRYFERKLRHRIEGFPQTGTFDLNKLKLSEFCLD
ncbi:MAG: hypothetical protein OEV87_11780 [Phycisphaerae bacterium]|nr:hypothetical protein [Phycisphaerae bacterium]